MPLANDPSKYPEAMTFYHLACIVVGGEEFNHTFETNGEVHKFSQRFYGYRKAVKHRLKLTEANVAKLADTGLSVPADLAELAIELARIFGIMDQVIVRKPDGSNGKTIRIVHREVTGMTVGEDFIAENVDKIPSEHQGLYE